MARARNGSRIGHWNTRRLEKLGSRRLIELECAGRADNNRVPRDGAGLKQGDHSGQKTTPEAARNSWEQKTANKIRQFYSNTN